MDLLGGGRIKLAQDAPVDARIGSVAKEQRGRVARWQLLAAGVDRNGIWRRVRNGRLEREHHGVYRLPHTSEIPLGDEVGALLACGETAVLSHHSAATLWGLRPGRARPIHVTIPAHRGFPAPAGVRLHRSRTLTDADIRIHNGLPVTSPARVLLDVAPDLPDRDVERMMAEAVFVKKLVTLREIQALLKRAGNHPGRRRLTRVASANAVPTDSRPAETLFRMIRDAGLPEPRTEVPVLDYRLDLFWPDLNLAVEVDAYGTHGSPGRFEADRRRDARLLTERGIQVIRITRAMIEQRPLEALALVARAIGQREGTIRSSGSRSR